MTAETPSTVGGVYVSVALRRARESVATPAPTVDPAMAALLHRVGVAIAGRRFGVSYDIRDVTAFVLDACGAERSDLEYTDARVAEAFIRGLLGEARILDGISTAEIARVAYPIQIWIVEDLGMSAQDIDALIASMEHQ